MGLKVANNAYGTLNAGINSSATTIVLNAGEGSRFPTLSAGDYFYATLIDTTNNLEVVKVTARSTDTMTVVRGQDNTTARAYSTNDRFELRPTAAMFTETIDKADAALPKTGGTVTGNLNIGDSSFGGIGGNRRLCVREDATDSSFKGIKVNNSGGSGSVAGVYFQGYDWVQGGIWHGRSASGTERSGALVLGTNPNTSDLSEGGLVGRLIIDNDGRVRLPYQPAFKAVSSANTFTPSTGQFTTTYDVAVVNRGGHFNTSTGRFTAPVAGVYFFYHQMSARNTTSSTYEIKLYDQSGTEISRLFNNGSGSSHGAMVSVVQSMAAGDYVQAGIYNGSSVTFSGSADAFANVTTVSGWGGYLLG